MTLKRALKTGFVFCVILINVGCDQISKGVVRNSVIPNETISLLNDHFIVTNVENSGAFLSLGDSLPDPVKLIFLTILPLLILVFCSGYVLLKSDISRLNVFAICCIIGGGIGNIFDRITYGSVTDFMHVDLGFFKTGIFNAADISIMFGAILALFFSFTKKSTDEIKPSGL